MNFALHQTSKLSVYWMDTYLRRVDPHGVFELVLQPPRLRLQTVGVTLAGDDEARPVVLDDAGEADLLRFQILSGFREPPEGCRARKLETSS